MARVLHRQTPVNVHDEFEAINGYRPTLPSDIDIIEKCRIVNCAQLDANIRGVAVDAAGHRFWVKFGTGITLAEALTQHYVARVVSRHGDAAPVRVPAVYRFLERNTTGYIVMEFVKGHVCNKADAQAVADAVSFLIKITAPPDQPGPGPIGGGPVCHPLFVDRISSVAYPTLELLSSHINGILRRGPVAARVDLAPEVEEYGLRLCLSDTNSGNFMRDGEDTKIVAVDFGASCFLPISFFEMALGQCRDPFTQLIHQLVKRPSSTQADLLHRAYSILVMYQNNNIDLPAELKASNK